MRRVLLAALCAAFVLAGSPARAETAVGFDLGTVNGIATDSSTGNVYISASSIFKITPAGTIEALTYTAPNGYDVPLSGSGIAWSDGFLYLTYGNQVWRWNESKKRTLVAGTGEPGFSGDGQAATAAKLWYAVDVAADGLGNLYVSDWNNSRIRVIDSSGNIATAVGSNGTADGEHREIPPLASMQVLDHPEGIGVDSHGILYVADSWHRRAIRMLPGGLVTRVAGTGRIGRGGEGGPAYLADTGYLSDVAADDDGNVWIAEHGETYIEPREPFLIRVGADGFLQRFAGFGTIGEIAVAPNGHDMLVAGTLADGTACVWRRTADGSRVAFAGRC